MNSHVKFGGTVWGARGGSGVSSMLGAVRVTPRAPLGVPPGTSAHVKVVKVVKPGDLLGAHTQNGQVVKVVKPSVPCMCGGIPPGGPQK